MRFTDIRIGVRINAGYAILIVLMICVILVAVSRIYAIRAESDHILQHDWAAATAVNTINTESLEAATRIGAHALWLTSHGRNSKGKRQDARLRFFATTVPENGVPSRPS